MQVQDETTTVVLEFPNWANLLLWATVALAAIWLLLTLFVYMRRKASNLTPVNAPDAKKSAAPDFMKVDHKAREEQIKRGETFEKDLDAREAAEASEAKKTKQATALQRAAGFATLLFSLFSLVATGTGVIWQVGVMGNMLSQWDKIGMALQKYPIPFAVCVFVIGYYVVTFITQKKWKAAAR